MLVAGWLVAIPVPFVLMWAPAWNWVIAANVLLGVSQGLTWSTTVIMKIYLVGPQRRGLAMGLNEFSGYIAVAGSALATGWIAAHYGLRPQPFYLGIVYVAAGLLLSTLAIRETRHHVTHELRPHHGAPQDDALSQREIFRRTTWADRNLSSISQAGLVNNLNDGIAWGLFPLVFAAGGMGVQAAGIAVTAGAAGFAAFALGAVLLGLGTAMVYPILLAAIGDIAHPSWRASAAGVYRLWRDLGYAAGALLAGFTADLFGLAAAVWLAAGLTLLSGVAAAVRMTETLAPTGA